MYDIKVFKQDLGALVHAFGEEDYWNANIFANRIMGNSIFGDRKDLALAGFFLKDVSLLLGSLKAGPESKAFSSGKLMGDNFAKRISELSMDDTLPVPALWQEYFDFMSDIRRFLLDPYENSSYLTPNEEFSKESFRFLVKRVSVRKNILTEPYNKLLKGIINEMGRIRKTHGIEKNDVYFMPLFIALDRCNEYIGVVSDDPEIFRKRIEEEILPHVEKVLIVLGSDPINETEVTSILWELIAQWRKYFIEYMDIRLRRVKIPMEPEGGIEIPQETREKLTRAITESLEK